MVVSDALDVAPSLQRRMLRAAAWLVGSNVASQGLRLLSSLVLTRLLAPLAITPDGFAPRNQE